MAQLENSSAGVFKLRNSLNKDIEKLKDTQMKASKCVDDCHSFWQDHQYDAFKIEYDEGITKVALLYKSMEEFDKKLQELQTALKKYEDLKIKPVFK